METWQITILEILGAAKRATVRHRLADGSTVLRRYSWPRAITRAEIEAVLDAEHVTLMATPTPAAGYDEALDLVGAPREIAE